MANNQDLVFLTDSIYNLEFWSRIQADIQERNLQVNTENLYLNYQNNWLLQQQTQQLDCQTRQLNSIEAQLQELQNIINSKYDDDKRENFSREVIYNIKKMSDSLANYEDNVFIFFEATSLLEIIRQNEISTTSFTQIQDKEYFDKILVNLESKAKDISENDKNDLENFISLYLYARELEKEVSDLKQERIELVNFPENLEEIGEVEKPKMPEILEIKEELEYEIENQGENFSIFSKNITKFIKSPSKLQEFFEEFFKTKKNYEKEMLHYNYIGTLKSFYEDSLKKKDKGEELFRKLEFSIHAVNKYLENHSDLEKYYPKISDEKLRKAKFIIDFNEAKKSYYDDFLQKTKNLEESLDNYYLKEIELFKQKRGNRKTKIRKFGNSSGNAGCVVFIILVIVVIFLVKKFFF